MAIFDMAPFAKQNKNKEFHLKNIRLNSYFLDKFLVSIQFAGTHYN